MNNVVVSCEDRSSERMRCFCIAKPDSRFIQALRHRCMNCGLRQLVS
jgi:hypothetical protein